MVIQQKVGLPAIVESGRLELQPLLDQLRRFRRKFDVLSYELKDPSNEVLKLKQQS